MKFEGGVHRVQRVPRTEKQGRIHTSTMTVAILPQPAEVKHRNGARAGRSLPLSPCHLVLLSYFELLLKICSKKCSFTTEGKNKNMYRLSRFMPEFVSSSKGHCTPPSWVR